MNVGNKILELRKNRGYSQEDIANKLNVSRQTVSKWETNQSTPDFDKIVPLCKLFEISTDEFLMGNESKNVEKNKIEQKSTDVKSLSNENELMFKIKRRFALGLCISILLYFVSVMWIIFGEAIGINDEINVVIFLGIAGLATSVIVYSSVINKNKVKSVKEKKDKPIVKSINDILSLVFLIIYLFVSFKTEAWYITWILWIVYAVICQIVRFAFELGEKNE